MNPENKLISIQKRVALTDTEKAEGRGRLLAHMALTKRKAEPSPLSFMAVMQVRYGAAFLALLLLSGGGVLAASEDATPGDTLYGVKLTVTEPTLVALTFNRKEKAALEVEYAERRLKELTVASKAKTLDEGTTRLIAASLENRIEGAEEEISELVREGEGGDAYHANSELRGVLSTHAKILKKVAGEDPTLAAISLQIEASATASVAAEPELTAALDSQESRGVLRESVEESQEEVVAILEDLRIDMESASTTLDQDDHVTLTDSLSEVTGILEAATREKDEGSAKEALKLYSSADSMLGELKTLIEAEQELGLDLIGGEE
ncbi:MAG TPA: DUF5667 domain-containing protein [Candidatus Paceibacterota bacterium]|nr:DUF5667 domain-containing protein [Candidatus Paceibacterota bacterium]